MKLNILLFFIAIYSSMLYSQGPEEKVSPILNSSSKNIISSPPLTPAPSILPLPLPVKPEGVKPVKSIETSKIIKSSEEDEGPVTLQDNLEYTKKIQGELEQIKNLAATKYIQDIDQYRVAIDRYIEHKKRVCNGEFTTSVLEEEQSSKDSKFRRKLNSGERKLCFREMKALQVTMINNMYIARKRFLEYMHEERMKELSLARDKVMAELQNTFSR